MVQRFLRFIRPEELSVKLLDLNALLTDVASLLEAEWKEEGIAFTFQFDPSLPLIPADEELLRQAFLNILLNACQAMPDGGKVKMSTERENGFINVSIVDTGVGITVGVVPVVPAARKAFSLREESIRASDRIPADPKALN